MDIDKTEPKVDIARSEDTPNWNQSNTSHKDKLLEYMNEESYNQPVDLNGHKKDRNATEFSFNNQKLFGVEQKEMSMGDRDRSSGEHNNIFTSNKLLANSQILPSVHGSQMNDA